MTLSDKQRPLGGVTRGLLGKVKVVADIKITSATYFCLPLEHTVC